jgi:hypothetical protein
MTLPRAYPWLRNLFLLAMLCLSNTAPLSAASEDDAPTVEGKRLTPAIQLDAPALPLFTHDIVAQGLTGSTYYVSPTGDDDAEGTEAAPLRTLQAAADKTRPGDTVRLRGGTYAIEAELAQLEIRTSGTPENWIRYANYAGETPRIVFKSIRGILVSGASYIVIEGIEFDGQSQLIDPAAATTFAENFKGDDYSQTHFFSTGIRVEGNGATGEALRYAHHVIIRGNRFLDCAGGGIASARADYLLIQNNTVTGSAFYSPWGTSGISVWQSANFDQRRDVYRTVIVDNYCRANDNKVRFWMNKQFSDGNGIIVDALATDQKIIKDGYQEAYSGRVLIANNISVGNGGRGINLYESNHIDVYHNTLVENSTRAGGQNELEVGRVTDCRIHNNLIVPRADKSAVGGYQSHSITVDYNLLGGDMNAPSEFTFGAHNLRTTKPALVRDPLSAAVTTPEYAAFQLTADSPARRAGAAIYAWPVDISGQPRPTSADGPAPDLGAWQSAP